MKQLPFTVKEGCGSQHGGRDAAAGCGPAAVRGWRWLTSSFQPPPASAPPVWSCGRPGSAQFSLPDLLVSSPSPSPWTRSQGNPCRWESVSMETGFSRCKCDFDSVARTPGERMVTDHPGSSWQLQLAWTGSYFERLGRFRYPADGRVSEIRRCVDQSGSAGGRSSCGTD